VIDGYEARHMSLDSFSLQLTAHSALDCKQKPEGDA
jgi:hypothetical protein